MQKKLSVTQFLCKFYVYILLLAMYAPLLLLIIYSFTNTKLIGNWNGFSLHLYEALFKDKEIMQAFFNTFLVAISSAVVSTVLGTLGAIGIFYSGKKSKAVLEGMSSIPVMNAEIVTALSLTILFVFCGIQFNFITLLIGHVVLTIPFVVLSVRPKLIQMDPNIYEAALDLGASPIKALFKVIIPTILPGVISGFAMAFTISLDDFIITQLTKGSSTGIDTLSTYLYSSLRNASGLKPFWLPVFSIIIVLVVFIVLFSNLRSYKNEGKKEAK